jgi:hypothetical protein
MLLTEVMCVWRPEVTRNYLNLHTIHYDLWSREHRRTFCSRVNDTGGNQQSFRQQLYRTLHKDNTTVWYHVLVRKNSLDGDCGGQVASLRSVCYALQTAPTERQSGKQRGVEDGSRMPAVRSPAESIWNLDHSVHGGAWIFFGAGLIFQHILDHTTQHPLCYDPANSMGLQDGCGFRITSKPLANFNT